MKAFYNSLCSQLHMILLDRHMTWQSWNKQANEERPPILAQSLRYVSYFVLASSQPCWIAHAELPRCTVALSIFLRLFSHICTHSARPLIITGTRYYLLLLPPRVTTIRELQFKLNPSKKPPSLDDTINSVPTATEAFCKARKLLSYYWRESCRFLVVSLLKRSNRSLARDTIQMSWV